MKILHLALKDMLRNTRSPFLMMMMFIIPLLITGLIFLAFGNSDEGVVVPATRLVIVNHDQSANLEFNFSRELVGILKDEELQDLLIVSEAGDVTSAVEMIQAKEADTALIIPEEFSNTMLSEEGRGELTLIADPTLTVQLKVVQTILENIVNGFNGARIAVTVAGEQFAKHNVEMDQTTLQAIVAGYTEFLQRGSEVQGDGAYLKLREPQTGLAPQPMVKKIMTGIMGAQLIFFVFFTGTTFAQSLLNESEEKTLARLLTTPTTMPQILAAKVIGAMLMILIQAGVLLLLSSLIFKMKWGSPFPLVLTILSIDLAAAAFGIMVMSFAKNSQQAGFMVGGVMTATNMAGIFPIMMQSNLPALNTASLFVPQGWAMSALKMTIDGASIEKLITPLGVLLAFSVVCFVLGVYLFRRRFA